MIFDFFKIFKKANRLKSEHEEVIKKPATKKDIKKASIIREELALVYARIDAYNKEVRIKCEEETTLKNNVCPNCSSTNTIDKISQVKGEIHGNSSSYGGFGGYSSHSKIDGEMNTHAVNKCSDCNNEWVKETPLPFILDCDFIAMQTYFVIKSEHTSANCTFDATDPLESFSTIEEKRESLKRTRDGWIADIIGFWSGIHIETLELFTKTNDRRSFCERHIKDWDIQHYKSIGLVEFTEEELNITK